MADALASGASVLYGRGGSSPPSPTVKIPGSVKASGDFLFVVAVGVRLGLKQRQTVGLSFNSPLTLSGTYGQVSGTCRWILLTYRCFFGTYAHAVGQALSLVDALFTCGHAVAHR